MPSLEDAIALAVQAHRGQTDKAGAPYILHPMRVMFRVDTDHERMTAVLHDVIEDTTVTIEKLAGEGFPDEVLRALECLTRDKRETYEAFIERLLPNALARRVKLADLEDNSDLTRIANPTDRDRERVKKYARAIQYLKETQER